MKISKQPQLLFTIEISHEGATRIAYLANTEMGERIGQGLESLLRDLMKAGGGNLRAYERIREVKRRH